ncbi:MAG: GIY-YIG nuclease family protein [Clostridium sp.]|uniref:GIY-YIG nuclease family protein n=1 Tax=Clostridium sp. TaxID=1506 RepID=UPI00290F801B|nr:GIY-YIG nuclease family protein [Clostridium sp.]MDU3548957.1 GIY-YIG nuclease family protein [Clostridium sp.]
MSEYNNEYYKNNSYKWKEYSSSDKYKEYHKKYYLDNQEVFSLRNKSYYENNKDKNKGKFIYFIIDETREIKYIGKTNNLYNRFYSHTFKKEKFDINVDTVVYLDFSKDGIDEEELYDLEQHFIEIIRPYKNKQAGKYDTSIIDKLNKKLNFKEFKFKRIDCGSTTPL